MASPVAPGLQNQQFGEAENIRSMPPATTMPAPPMPMPPRQPRPSLIVGGPAYFTPEGYQAPVQPEQAFMPTDTRPDPIGENFRRQYPDRPMPPPPMPTPQPQPEPPFDPGPITGGPVYPDPITTPTPAPQPEYDPYAQSDLGKRALGGEYINSKTFHWFDPKTGKSGSTTEGWSRVPDAVKGYTYLDAESAADAKQKFMTFEDRGSTPGLIPTPITTPAPTPITETPITETPVETVGAGFDPTQGGTLPGMDEMIYLDYMGTDEGGDYRQSGGKKTYLPKDPFGLKQPSPDVETPIPSPIAPPPAPKELTLPSGKTIDLAQIQASLAGLNIPNMQMPSPLKVPAPAATDSSMLGGSMLGMSADALRAEGGTPQPSTGGGFFRNLIAQAQGETSPVATTPAPVERRAPLPFDLEPQIRDETAQVERPLQERAPIAPISEPRMPDPLTSVAAPVGMGGSNGNNALTGDFNPYERVTGATNPVYTPPPAPVAPPQIEQIEQIKQVIPQLPPEQLQQVIPQLPPEILPAVLPQLPPEVIQQVIPQLPPEVIQQILPQLPVEVMEQLTMPTPQVSMPSPMMPMQRPNLNTRRMNPRLPTR